MTSSPGLALALFGVVAAGMPCGSGPRLPSSLDRAARTVGDATEAAGAGVNAAIEKCDAMRTQDVVYEEERTIGEAAGIQLAADNGGLVIGADEKAPLSAPTVYLNKIGQLLGSVSERPHLRWTFAIVDSEAVNAYSTPGGLVFVTRGLLKKVENEAQLAGVLAHEIAHITGRHALNRYRQMKSDRCRSSQVSSAAATVAGATTQVFAQAIKSDSGHLKFKGAEGMLAEMGGDLASSVQNERFDPTAEKQADYDALGLMVMAGYQPEEYAKFLEGLPDTYQSKTHPPKKDRVANVRSTLKQFASDSSNPLRSGGAPYGEAEGFKADPIGDELAALK